MRWAAAPPAQAAAPKSLHPYAMGCRAACTGSGAQGFLRRNADQADRGRRSTGHADALWQASGCVVSLALVPRGRRALSRRPLERGVSRRLAPSRVVRGAVLGFDLATGACQLQGALSAGPP